MLRRISDRVRRVPLLLITLSTASGVVAGCRDDTIAHPRCVAGDAPASGDLARDMVGRWQLVRHYTDTRYYQFHADDTADVWYVGLDEPTTHATVGWSVVDDTVVHTDESPPVDFAMTLGPSPIGNVWRAPAEYVFRPCAV